MLRPVPERPRRDLVKRAARAFLLASGQDTLPVDIDSLFQPGKQLLLDADEAEKATGMRLPVDFLNNPTAEALTCFYSGVYVTIYKRKGRSPQRIRFSKAHELGHIALNHLTEFEQPDSFSFQKSRAYHVLEREADMFAAELLAPTPVLKELGMFDVEHIQLLCDISRTAAELTVSDMNMDLNVSESDKNAVLRRFHRYIFTAGHLQRLSVPICPHCRGALKGDEHVCGVCGKAVNRRLCGHPQRYGAPLVTPNGRLLYCTKCGNASFQGGQTNCGRCGQPLYNQCTNPEHKKLLPAFSRYCPICGGPSTFLETGAVIGCAQDRRLRKQEDGYFNRTIEGIPLSNDWHYWLEEVLVKEDISLYLMLKGSAAVLDEDDLIIYADVKDVPVNYIRDSLKKYCELDITSVSVEQGGGFEHEISPNF